MNLLEESLRKANDIFDRSENLSRLEVDAFDLYNTRHNYYTDILGDGYYISFYPQVENGFLLTFKDLVKDVLKYLWGSHDCPEDMEGRVFLNELYSRNEIENVTEAISRGITSDNLVNNTVPADVKSVIDFYSIKGLSSPKLSKLLVKLYGEKSDIVKWYTNKCPRQDTKTEVFNYKIVLSVLPHHIAGMSYYAPLNWGGRRWKNGWQGTSCMDTIQNSAGKTIYKLPPNLLDHTCAIAFLIEDGNDDFIYNPRYLARTLIRLVEVEDTFVLVGSRTYGVSNEVQFILEEGLSNRFHNFIHVNTIRRYPNSLKKYRTKTEYKWIVNGDYEIECSECDGEGCSDCDYEGTVEIYDCTPYVDDEDVIAFMNGNLVVMLPDEWLRQKGMVGEKVESIA